MDRFISLLYPDSPFLPSASPESLAQIKKDMREYHLSPIVSIAKEVALEGAKLNKVHQAERGWLAMTFKVDMKNLDDFMIGFITPPTLIMGGHVLMTRPISESFKLFMPPTKDPILMKHNAYKSDHLFTAYFILMSVKNRLPSVGAAHFYDLCRNNPYQDEFYYLAGIDASERLFAELANLLFPL
jgi:hypothetical protein